MLTETDQYNKVRVEMYYSVKLKLDVVKDFGADALKIDVMHRDSKVFDVTSQDKNVAWSSVESYLNKAKERGAL